MAAEISENYVSRPFTLSKQNGRELIYDIIGTDDESEVQTLLEGVVAGAYLGLELESIEAEPLGGGVWKGHAKYLRLLDTDEYTFDTGGGTAKITQAPVVNSYAPSGHTAPDFDGAIGVSEDKVEGVDITIPAFQWTETHRFGDTFILGGYKAVLFGLTGKINDDTFKGFAAGEVLFLGASGSKRGDEIWSITFRFSASGNATGLTIGSITGIAKGGWDYLWVRYAEEEDSAAKSLVKKPSAVYVHKVYQSGDFSTLTIGT